MTSNSYLNLEGEIQGDIEGSSTQTGQQNKIVVYGWNHEVAQPLDAASGEHTGKRQHHALTITKPVDKSTPKLMTVLVTNENIHRWRLECYRKDQATNQLLNCYTIELENAHIAGIKVEQLNNKFPKLTKHEIYEYVSFTYERIVWTWEDGGITAEDYWEAAVT